VVTVATNMAGRGTDIALGPGVHALGGLHVILTEFHESPRVDRQLFGRAARQGDPGSAQAIVSLQDDAAAAPRRRAEHSLLAARPSALPTAAVQLCGARCCDAWRRRAPKRMHARTRRDTLKPGPRHRQNDVLLPRYESCIALCLDADEHREHGWAATLACPRLTRLARANGCSARCRQRLMPA
jgi:hypothetical protein